MRIGPRFSVRTLFVMLTLICAYLACWGPTRRYAASLEGKSPLINKPDTAITVAFGPKTAGAPAPLLIYQDEIVFLKPRTININAKRKRIYYLWLFGPTFRIPFESDSNEPMTLIID